MRADKRSAGRAVGVGSRGWVRAVRAIGLGVIAVLLAGQAVAAEPGAGGELLCSGGEPAEADLGIGGFSCRCSVKKDREEGSELWQFGTEPQILSLREGGPAEGVLHEGDRVVAVDGVLITTPAGGLRWSKVRPGERVELRVRRGPAVETVELEVGARCPDSPASSGAQAEAPPEEATGLVTSRELPDLPELPELPDLSGELTSILPRGWLGLGLACHCMVQAGEDGPLWTFYDTPSVGAVDEGGPASRSGIRPGDLLVEIDGEELTGQAGAASFSSVRPGQRVRLTVRREGIDQVVEVVAGERPEA